MFVSIFLLTLLSIVRGYNYIYLSRFDNKHGVACVSVHHGEISRRGERERGGWQSTRGGWRRQCKAQ